MSNVRPRMKTANHCALSLRTVPPEPSTRVALKCSPAKSQMRLYPAASSHSSKSTRRPSRRSASLASRCGLRAEGGSVFSQLLVRASRGLNGQFVVGASRRSAAPGRQLVGAAGYGSILPSPSRYSWPMLSKVQLHVVQRKVSCPGARPNPLQGLPKQSTVLFSLPSRIEFGFDA